MWIFTRYGFFSVVCARKSDNPNAPIDKSRVMVRARSEHHLKSLRKRFHLRSRIRHTGWSDYPYRILIDKRNWAFISLKLSKDIDYDNFKKEVAGTNCTHYIQSLHEVWQVMRDANLDLEAGFPSA